MFPLSTNIHAVQQKVGRFGEPGNSGELLLNKIIILSAKRCLARCLHSLSMKEKFYTCGDEGKRGAEKGAGKGRVWRLQGSTVIGAIRSSLEWK